MLDITLILDQLKSGQNLVCKQLRAVVGIKGPDARAFLQRMSSNDLDALNPKIPIQTSFINNKGGMIDHCAVFETGPNQFIIVSSHKHATILINWLERYHFVEDFTLSDESKNEPATVVISRLLDTKAFKYWRGILGDQEIGFYLDFGEPENSLAIDEPSFETLRIAAFMPGSPYEINETFMPQNINLESFIADNKGCYIGQEVIAKARIYQKRVKTLRGLMISREEFEKLSLGKKLATTDNLVGTITSIAPYFVADMAQALVMVETTSTSRKGEDVPVILKEESFRK